MSEYYFCPRCRRRVRAQGDVPHGCLCGKKFMPGRRGKPLGSPVRAEDRLRGLDGLSANQQKMVEDVIAACLLPLVLLACLVAWGIDRAVAAVMFLLRPWRRW